jgi:hypothetical protein
VTAAPPSFVLISLVRNRSRKEDASGISTKDKEKACNSACLDQAGRTRVEEPLQKQVAAQNSGAVHETHSGRIAAKSLFFWSVAWASAVNQEEKEAVIVTNWLGR